MQRMRGTVSSARPPLLACRCLLPLSPMSPQNIFGHESAFAVDVLDRDGIALSCTARVHLKVGEAIDRYRLTLGEAEELALALLAACRESRRRVVRLR